MVLSILVGITVLLFSRPTIAACDLANLVETAAKWDFLLRTGDHSNFDNLSYDLIYKENDKPASILQGVAALGLQVSANRTYYDTTLCKFISEHVVTNPTYPYIIETQTYVVDGIVEQLDVVVTQEGDFQFKNATSATVYQDYAYSQNSKWDLLPMDKRDARQVLQAAADAYFEHLHDRSAFPVASSCSIVSAGRWSGADNLTVADSCTHKPKDPGVPTQTMRDRRYVIDEAYGVVNIFTRFEGLDHKRPNESTSDSHLFRIEDGKVRYIHSASVCVTPLCGWPERLIARGFPQR